MPRDREREQGAEGAEVTGDATGASEVNLGANAKAEAPVSPQPARAEAPAPQPAQAQNLVDVNAFAQMFAQAMTTAQVAKGTANYELVDNLFTVPEGGKFLVNGRWVDADNRPLKVSSEDRKLAEKAQANQLAAHRATYRPAVEDEVEGEV